MPVDPYAEVNRRDRKSGLSPVGWFFVVLGGFFTLGFMSLVGLGLFMARQASSVLEDLREDPTGTFVELAEFVDEDVEVVDADEGDGTVTLRVRETGDLVSVDLSQLPSMLGGESNEAVRFNGEADESGGVLTIQTPGGETRIELRGDEAGGFLRISTPDDDMHFGAGGEASSVPDWLPVHPDARVQKGLFSAATDDGRVGAVLYRIDEDPKAVLEWYQDQMPEGGFRVSSSSTTSRDGRVEGKIEWDARAGGDEREVSVAVGSDDEDEGFLLLFYREEG
ncbi:MAG: hypothetical protein HKN73_16315 [Gemmatimonadetes bacterium]|nr:hypothetical protein [Gemmatimonadota bacterium]